MTDNLARGLEIGTSRPPIDDLLRAERQVLTGVLGGDRSSKGHAEPEPAAERTASHAESNRGVVRPSRFPLLAGAGVVALLLGGGGYAIVSGNSEDTQQVTATADPTATQSVSASPRIVARVIVPGTASMTTAGAAASIPVTADTEIPEASTISVAAGPTAIRFTDGSILRLDSGTAFTTGADPASRGTLTSGRAWSRTTGAYTLRTSSGPITAAGGTAFAVDCTSGACLTSTFAGSATSSAGAIAAGYGTIGGAIKPTNWDMTFALPFLRASADADAAVDGAFPDALGLSRAIGVRFASFAGTFTGTRTMSACTGTDCNGVIPVGDKAARTYVFAVTCANGFPCTANGSTQYLQEDVMKTAKVPMTYDGKQVRYTFAFASANCLDGSGQNRASFVWTFTPVTAGAVGGVWAVTRTTGTGFVTNRSSPAGNCDAKNGTNSSVIDVSRTG